jgi:hypothetical protein
MTVNEVANSALNSAQNMVINATSKIKENSLEKIQSASNKATILASSAGNNVKMLSSLLCSPAIVYLAISITTLSSAFVDGMDTSMFGIRLAKLCLWTYCVNYLCISGFTSISWGVVMIPYTLIILQLIGILPFPKQYLNALLSRDEQIFFGV